MEGGREAEEWSKEDEERSAAGCEKGGREKERREIVSLRRFLDSVNLIPFN